MIEEDRRLSEPKAFAEGFDEALADESRAQRAAPLALHGGHDRPLVAPGAHGPVQRQIRIDIERRAVVADPVADRHAHTGNWPRAGPDLGLPGAGRGLDAEIVEYGNQDVPQVVEIGFQSQLQAIQGKDRINGGLTRCMQHAAAAAIDPAHRPAPGP